MKRYLMIMVVLAAFCLLPSFVFAQGFGGHDADRLQNAIERTDEIIGRAKEVVAESGSERARFLLENAIRLQEMSKDLMNRAVDFNEMTAAATSSKRTFEARIKAQRAIAITRREGENEQYVKNRIERTDNLLRRISENISAETPAHILRQFENAREKQGRAIEFFHNRKLRAALQLTIQVENSIEEAAQRFNQLNHAENRYLALSDQYFNLIERIDAGNYGSDDSIAKRIEAAEKARDDADRLFAEGKYRQAENKMSEAVDILRSVHNSGKDTEKIESAIQFLQGRAEELREKVQNSNNNRIQKMFGDAIEHLDKGNQYFHQNMFGDAAAQLQAARQLMARVANMLGE